MSKKRQKTDLSGFTETGLPTPEKAIKETAKATDQPETAKESQPGKLYSKADLEPKPKKKPRKYTSHAGRKRFNTMMHPDLIKALNTIAENNNQTLPDVIETIICDYLGIDKPTEK